LDNNPASRELLEDTGLCRRAQKAPLGNFVRYVCHGGKLIQLPQKPQMLLSTPLLSFSGKLRLLGDLWKKPAGPGLTIGQWAEYRFGREVLPLVDAAVTGTFAGDYQRLSIDAVMPGVRKLEREQGSVLKGLVKKKKAAHKKTSRHLPAMTSFPGGMEELITTLAENHPPQLHTMVSEILESEKGWQVISEAGGHFSAPKLILALPVNQALQLLHQFAPPVAHIPVSKIVTVVLGFGPEARVPYGFGYLAPEREKRFSLGALFSTHMFPGRAPEGKVLLEALVGGRRHPEKLEILDAEMVQHVYDDLKELMELPKPPCYAKVLRSGHGIPQLEMDHPALLAWKKELTNRAPGLHLCGFGWEGIGMNDMIKAARLVAESIRQAHLQNNQAAPEVKPVYF
jgi:oxygen-dependent protoporphyrinogen oxidase